MARYTESGCKGMSSIDEIIDFYKRDVDQSLVDACLKRSVEERIQALEDFGNFLTDFASR